MATKGASSGKPIRRRGRRAGVGAGRDKSPIRTNGTKAAAARRALADPLAKYRGAIDLGAPDVADRHDAYLADTHRAGDPR